MTLGIFFTLFFIFIAFLLTLFITWSVNYEKNHDSKGHTRCRECGCTPDITLYTESIWGEKHYCIECADIIGDKKKYVDYHYNEEDNSLI